MRPGFGKILAFRRGLGVSAALLLATAALAGLSIQSVYREAQVRKGLIAATHRSIADVVSARLDAAMLDADRAASGELQGVEPRAEIVLQKIQQLEASGPWLEPLVLVSASRTTTGPRSRAAHSGETFAAAERAEYREQSPLQAAALYAKAAAETTGRSRAAALNGQARAELKTGNPLLAANTYKKLMAEAERWTAKARVWPSSPEISWWSATGLSEMKTPAGTQLWICTSS
jgi:hypothetical protein